jgi:hypothetical protein
MTPLKPELGKVDDPCLLTRASGVKAGKQGRFSGGFNAGRAAVIDATQLLF